MLHCVVRYCTTRNGRCYCVHPNPCPNTQLPVHFPWSCSRIILLITSIRQPWLSLTDLLSHLNCLDFLCGRIYFLRGALIFKTTWKIFSILHLRFSVTKTNTILSSRWYRFFFYSHTIWESLYSNVLCVVFLTLFASDSHLQCISFAADIYSCTYTV